jgi:hypothetical protein
MPLLGKSLFQTMLSPSLIKLFIFLMQTDISTRAVQSIPNDCRLFLMRWGTRSGRYSRKSKLNWYKGKQTKHMKETELGQKLVSIPLFLIHHLRTNFVFVLPTVLTQPQRAIFGEVKAFMLENWKRSQYCTALLSMPNTFSGCEHQFIGALAEDFIYLQLGTSMTMMIRILSHGDSLACWRSCYLMQKRYRR